MIRGVWNIARHDLLLTVTDRSAVVWMVVMPVVFAIFFGLTFGAGGDRAPQDARATLTVVDQDGGPLARALIEELACERLAINEIAAEDKDHTEDKIRTLVIPADFSARLERREQVVIRLEKDPGSNLEAGLVAQVRINAAILRMIARMIEIDSGAAPAADSGQELPATDQIRVEARFAGKARGPVNGLAQSIPGMAVMFVMLVALTYGSASLSSERRSGLLRRVVTTPVSAAEIIAGKIAGRFLIAAVQVSLLVLVGVVAHQLWGVYIGDSALRLWLVLLVYAATVAPLGVILGAWFQDPDHAANVGILVTMVMAAFGGCWWPLEVVSKPLQSVAMLLPTGWAMMALHGVISFGNNLAEVLHSLLALLGFAVVFSIFAVRSLRIE